MKMHFNTNKWVHKMSHESCHEIKYPKSYTCWYEPMSRDVLEWFFIILTISDTFATSWLSSLALSASSLLVMEPLHSLPFQKTQIQLPTRWNSFSPTSFSPQSLLLTSISREGTLSTWLLAMVSPWWSGSACLAVYLEVGPPFISKGC